MFSSIGEKQGGTRLSSLTNFVSENWRKVNSDPVCFGARDDNYGAFTIQEPGLIFTFKLVHNSGSISCNPHYPESYWSCTSPAIEDANLMIVVTYKNKTALLLAEYLSQYRYALDGFSVNSETLVFNQLPVPLSVSVGLELQIWYQQDLTNSSEDSNSGQTCADVYAWYA